MPRDQQVVAQCSTCKFEEHNICKRYPPTVIGYHKPRDGSNEPHDYTSERRPYVTSTDWCGEWKPAKQFALDEGA